MYAWRGRIGLIKPTHRGKGFAFWYKTVPDGVEVVPTFIGFRSSDRATFQSGIGRAEEIAADLKEAGCNIIVVTGTPPFLLAGLEFERDWARRLSDKLGVPVLTPMEPHAVAMQAMGIKRIAVATYYGDELNQAIVRYFENFGIESEVMGGFSLVGKAQALYTTNLQALDDVSWMQVYDYCKEHFAALSRPVDAIYINGGGWDAAPAVQLLEQDLHTKVVLAVAAEVWEACHRLRAHLKVEGYGSLLRDEYPLPCAAPASR
jgi:maleate cis-trans isomerase